MALKLWQRQTIEESSQKMTQSILQLLEARIMPKALGMAGMEDRDLVRLWSLSFSLVCGVWGLFAPVLV